jgi:hypothetical protein
MSSRHVRQVGVLPTGVSTLAAVAVVAVVNVLVTVVATALAAVDGDVLTVAAIVEVAVVVVVIVVAVVGGVAHGPHTPSYVAFTSPLNIRSFPSIALGCEPDFEAQFSTTCPQPGCLDAKGPPK